MKMRFVLWVMLLSSFSLLAQQEWIVQGYLYDAETKAPIEFANVGIVSKGIGTISKETGFYGFTYFSNDAEPTDRLQFSILGYETLNLSLGKYHGLYGEERAKIYLKPAINELDVVNITNEERKYETIGFENLDNKTIGYWKDKKGLGGEIATRIRIKRERTKLLNLSFKISENLSDSLRIRVNVYDYKNKYPGKNILAKPIYHVISKDYGVETIDLKPYNIIVDEDIVVSIELIEIYGKKIGLALFGSFDRGTSYLRLVSQGDFDRADYIGMGFWLETSRPKSSGISKELKREEVNSMLLYWDASAASSERNFSEELELLKNFIKKQKDADITVVKFAMGYREKQRFERARKSWDELEDFLLDTNYDGDADFKVLQEDIGPNADAALLFTNGLSATSQLTERYEVPLFAVNSNETAADAALKDVCRLSGGHYINLARMNMDQAMRYLTYDLNDNLRYAPRGVAGQTGDIFGRVSNEAGPLPGAFIKVLGSFESTVSRGDGSFYIDADIGDIITVDYLGMKPLRLVLDQLGELDLVMETDGQLLDEVVVQAAAASEATTVDTPFGERNADAVGYDLQQVTRKDIGPQHLNLDQLVVKLPGVLVTGIGDEKRYTFARLTTGSVTLDTSPIIVVDGITYQQGQAPLDQLLPPIDPQTIESIVALKSVVASNRYGSLGAYGAIVIKTENSSMRFDAPKETNTALVKGNDFAEDLPRLEAVIQDPNYVVRYKNAANTEDAKALYRDFKGQKNMLNVPFLVNSGNYFRQVDGRFAKRLFSNLAVLAPNNAKILKTYAFVLEQQLQPKRAMEVYQTIHQLRPYEAQSLYDLAKAQVRAGAYEEAFENFKRILANQTDGVDYQELAQDATFEMKRLLNAHRDQLNTDDLPTWLEDDEFAQKIRVEVSWNDPLAEFEMQFVNPQGKFYNWSFDSFSNPEEMVRFRKSGVYTKSFEIAEDAPGIWQFNLRNIGAPNAANPAYLKYTLYLNYGTPFESQRTKVVNLAELPVKVVLDRFTNKR
ncbi:hypothetical protein [Gilvibacter sp.]|uniref:hypothetical protein n=1 Tax=Gilvibacter sp. TaxID=2729997 RepID=UPI003F4A39C7